MFITKDASDDVADELTLHLDGRNWARELTSSVVSRDKRGVLEAVRGGHNGLFFSVTSRFPLGTNVFDREWDLLIVLDACRVDAMRSVAPEFDFVEDVESIWSVGSASHEWLCKTFTEDYRETIANTVYVSTNPHVPTTFQQGERPPETYTIPLMYADWNVVSADDYQLLRHIHDHDYRDYYATIPADLVTDHAIQIERSHDFDNMIVHYFQPHRPYIGRAPDGERRLTDAEDEPWEAIRTGVSSVDEVGELYQDNLRYVLRSVGRLLENVDAETVAITADHGELFGEFGLYGHPEGFVHPNLKRVPWVETTGHDTGTSDPEVDVTRQEGDADPTQRLRDLGYL